MWWWWWWWFSVSVLKQQRRLVYVCLRALYLSCARPSVRPCVHVCVAPLGSVPEFRLLVQSLERFEPVYPCCDYYCGCYSSSSSCCVRGCSLVNAGCCVLYGNFSSGFHELLLHGRVPTVLSPFNRYGFRKRSRRVFIIDWMETLHALHGGVFKEQGLGDE